MVVVEEILSRLDDGRTRFVFPSEVAAASALAAALEASARRALPSRRFIGWDAFKSELFSGDERLRPSSKAIRSIFARSLLAENARAPFLEAVVPRGAAGASLRFARSVAAALPALDALPTGAGGHLGDWSEIRRRYEAFMERRGLYEAAWLGREAAATEDSWLLFYPDLTEDWDRYAEALAAMPRVSTILSDTLGAGTVSAARYDTIVEEIRAALIDIRGKVESGVDPASLAISVAAPEATLPVLEREAALAGLALDLREGSPLSESAGGRLFSDIKALAGPLSFAALRRLLLDASRPWKQPEAARRLLGIGIERHLVAQVPGTPDAWEAALSHDDEARRLYRGLRTSAARIAGAPGFRSLKAAFDAFKRAFLDEERWSARQDDELARCLAALDELAEAAEAAGLSADAVPGAAEAYAAMLEDTRYLPVSDSGGIPVYRFPVAAGAAPKAHYVLNLCQGAAEAAARPLSFLRSDLRDSLGVGDRDFSAGLIRLLALSGEETRLSYSEAGPDGARPPHPALESAQGHGYDRQAWPPSLEAEGRVPPRVFPLEASSAAAALRTVFASGANDWTRGAPERPQRLASATAEAVRAFEYRDGRPSLTATSMEEYAACAFKRIYRRVLRLEAVETGLSFIDKLLLGRIYHEAFERLLGPMAQAGQAFVWPEAAGEAARPDSAAAAEAMRSTLDAVGAREGPVAAALIGAAEPVLLCAFKEAVAALTEAADGYRPILADDKELRTTIDGASADGERIGLRGRPDLLCEAPGADGRPRAMIFDYKKRGLPTKASLAPGDDGTLEHLQIPLYAMLAEDAGYRPEAAAYLSIEGRDGKGASLCLVFGPGSRPAIADELRPLLRPAVEARARATAARLSRGEVYVPAPRDRDRVCGECDLRPVCRARYAVR